MNILRRIQVLLHSIRMLVTDADFIEGFYVWLLIVIALSCGSAVVGYLRAVNFEGYTF